MKILVAGGSGFIGSRLIKSLSSRLVQDRSANNEVICMSRDPESLKGRFDANVSLVKADVSEYESLVSVMKDVDVAYYLVHSMEGSAKEWVKFAERDMIAAKNFARASTACGVKRIIYLSGLTHEKDDELSAHMQSRKEVGRYSKKETQMS